MGRIFRHLKNLLFGRPLASERLDHERLGKVTALAVLSSDAISSVAYATDQILIVLAVLGAAAVQYVVPISGVIVALLVLVGLSYRQTIFAYPGGGGSYTVARENLGVTPGLVAAAALLTDYILTVSVSIASGVDAIASAYPTLAPRRVLFCVAAALVLMVVNLRGVRDSGAAFRVPTYAFIAMMIGLIASGLYHWFAHAPDVTPVVATLPVTHPGIIPIGFAFQILLLRAFSEGCSAMTGTEAISNGVMVFKQPAARNAATTLVWMVSILAVFFLGTSLLAHHYQVTVQPLGETVLSQLGHRVFGTGFWYYALQYATFAVLVLAANTAFADFPRLASILANDRYMPRQLAARGDRLAFSNGIVTLALLAIFLIWIFRGNTNALIPLYAVGVFVCFTLSQAGMVVHWFRCRDSGWQWRAALNGLGAAATGIVSVIQVWTKFTTGAWIVVLIIPPCFCCWSPSTATTSNSPTPSSSTDGARSRRCGTRSSCRSTASPKPRPARWSTRPRSRMMSGPFTSRSIPRPRKRSSANGNSGTLGSISSSSRRRTVPSSGRWCGMSTPCGATPWASW